MKEQIENLKKRFEGASCPALMFEAKDEKGFVLKVFYDDALDEFLVQVSFRDKEEERRFRALFDPIFGMDVHDVAQAMELAELLALKIEQDLSAESPTRSAGKPKKPQP